MADDAAPDPTQTLNILITEHYNLQTARTATISETSARASLYLSTVSSGLVALGFIAQTVHGSGLYFVSLVLFPGLLFLGVATFERVLQLSIQDLVCARGINRIRHNYAEVNPPTARYFIFSTHDDSAGAMSDMSIRRTGWWQTFLTLAGTIEVINSIIAGVVVGLLVHLTGVSFGDDAVLVPIVVAVVAFFLSIVAHQRYQLAQWTQGLAGIPVLFPSPSSVNSTQDAIRR